MRLTFVLAGAGFSAVMLFAGVSHASMTSLTLREGNGNGNTPVTYIRADISTAAAGASSIAVAGNNASEQSDGTGDNDGPFRALFHFDVSAIQVEGPVSVNSASLTLHLDATVFEGRTTGTVDLHTTSPFLEATATWSDPDGDGNDANDTDGGGVGALLQSFTFDGSDSGATMTFLDSTAFRLAVANAVAGDGQLYLMVKDRNETIGIHPDNAGDAISRAHFASEDSTTAANRPTLEVAYTPVPEPASAALVGIGFTALTLRRRGRG